jgi:AcrR family transcriptional regulator
MANSKTRELIVERADALFYERGFEPTSFADIAEAVGISRGNFYHHFKTKDDILDAVLTLRMARTRAMLDDWQSGTDDPRDHILSFVRMLIANQTKIMAYGCPVGTLCLELAKLEHGARGRATRILGLFRDWLTEQFQLLGANDRSEELALHVLSWSQGVAVMATAFQDEIFICNEVAGIERWLSALPYDFNPKITEH